MEIIYKLIDELIPYINNPRKNDGKAVDKVAASIKEFGFKVPIIVDKDNVIVTGHTRYKASKKLKLKEVPTITADDLTDAQIKAFRIADNRVSEESEWDFEKLEIELEGLNIDLSILGFEDNELKFLDDKEVIEDDFDEEPPEVPQSKLGDIWTLGKHRLMCGDSTSDDVDVLIGNDAIDLVYTDAPYGIGIVDSKTNKVGAGNLAKNKEYMQIKGDNSTETAKLFYFKLKNKTNNFIMWGGNYFLNFLPFSSSFIVWDKRGDMNSNNFADGEIAWLSFHSRVRIYKQIWNGMIREGEKETRIHPTQKPVKIQTEIIKDFSNDNNTILDGFGGSGSALIACEIANRKCLMMEYEESYTDLIVRRYAKFKQSTDDIKLLREGKEYTYTDIFKEGE